MAIPRQRLLNNPDYVAQEKLDGMRAIVHITDNGLRIFSRSAGVDDPTKPLENTQSLPHLAALKFPSLVGTVLDAEILVRGVDSAMLAGHVNSRDGRDNTLVKLFVFDCLHHNGYDATGDILERRLGKLDHIKNIMVSEHIVFVLYVQYTANKQALLKEVFHMGGEGIMLKNLFATYEQGGRPANNWFKAKKSATYDCVVMGFTTGKGKYNTQIGAVRFGQYVNGKLVELGQASGMSDSERKELSRSPDSYIGKVVTIKGMERLKSGAIRHPQFVEIRSDKRAEECILYGGEQ